MTCYLLSPQGGDDPSGGKEVNDYGYHASGAATGDKSSGGSGGGADAKYRQKGSQGSSNNHSTSAADEVVESGDLAESHTSTGRALNGKVVGTAIESRHAASRSRHHASLDHSPSPSPPPPHSLQRKLPTSNTRDAQKHLSSSSSFSSAASTASSIMHSVLPSMSSSPLMHATKHTAGGDSEAILQLADEEVDAHAPTGVTFSFEDLFSEVTSSSTFSRIQVCCLIQ